LIRLNFKKLEGSGQDNLEIQIQDGELVPHAVERALAGVDLGERKAEEIFTVVVNGHIIPPDMWPFTKLAGSDNVLITPTLKGGDNSGLFRQVLFVAITAIATFYLGPAGLGLQGGALAAATAAVTIGAALLTNALIPPPVPNQDGLGGKDDISGSQMYAISGQSNEVRRFKTVPKVYGEHRMFPVIASNPYTDMEVDPGTGELAQYLYAIYDFGLGPASVRDLKIGNTSIDEFDDFLINFVDFNKPAVNEGPWDEALNNQLLYYKGDPTTENLSIALNDNQAAGGPEDGYKVIRNTPVNTDNSPQEIQLTFVNPRGLFAVNSGGVFSERTINLDIHFAEIGTDDWKAYNDYDEVSSFTSAGGTSVYDAKQWEIPQPHLMESLDPDGGTNPDIGLFFNPDTGGPYHVKLSEGGLKQKNLDYWTVFTPYINVWVRPTTYGFPAGATKVYAGVEEGTPFEIMENTTLIYNNVPLGKVQSVLYILAGTPEGEPYYEITLQEPLQVDVPIYSYEVVTPETRIHATDGKYYCPMGPAGEMPYKKWFIGPPTLGKAQISRADNGTVYSTFKFTPKNPGQYRVRIVRTSTVSSVTNSVSDELTLVGLTTRFDRAPIRTDKRHVFLEVKIRATNQLNGNITNLSGVVSSVVEVYNPNTDTWSKQESNNPAWIFTDLMIGQGNKRPLAKERLHLPSLVEWANYCDQVPDSPEDYTYSQKRFQTNFVLDYTATLQTVLNQVSNAAQASINVIDGKYGVLIDRRKDVPVQIFTPRNSRGFSSSRIYTVRPHGLKVKYIEPGKNWEVDEVIAYDNGYNAENAEEFEEITSFACTNIEQAWRFGRYNIAQNRLRQETMSITVDFEGLVCTRGDFVQITQDVMRVGGTPARVKSFDGAQITIDDGLEINPALTYGYTYRSSSNGQILTSTCTPIEPDVFELDGSIPAVGDLIVIGEVGKIVFDCIVKSITPEDDFSANIVLVEKADAVYDAESTTVFPEYQAKISTTSDPNFTPPGTIENFVIADSGWECADAGYRYFTLLDWDIPTGSVYEIFEIYVNDGRGFTLAGTTRDSFYNYTVAPDRLGIQHSYKVLAVSVTGKKLELVAVPTITNTPVAKNTPPSDVERLSTDITGEVLQLSWPQVNDCDVKEYLIRFSPTQDGYWEYSIPLLRVDRNTTLASTQARTGLYLIKAVDFNGNESVVAARAITTIPNLFNLNVIEEMTDFPDLGGGFEQTEQDSGALVLQTKVVGGVGTNEYYEEGYYYYENLLDLSEIYTVRLQSLIQAEGYTIGDLMINWDTLDSVQYLANSRNSEWDVETQYRSTESLNVMAEWITLDSVDPLSTGVSDNFTEWRKFTIGDATARIFQFRLKLISNKPNVTPRVFDGTIRADMPDRYEAYANLVATDTDGYELIYDPAFAGPTTGVAVQISIDGAESGDRWEFDYRDKTGFKIRFYDASNNPVTRTFDAAVKGYGRKAASII